MGLIVQKIFYSIIQLILSPHCLAGGHRSQGETTYAHFVVKNQGTLQFKLRLDMEHTAHIFEILIPISRTENISKNSTIKEMQIRN